MSSVFAPIYECFLFDSRFVLLFKQLFLGKGYALLGLTLILLPLVFFIFYYWDSRLPWGNPYRKIFSWVIWLIVTAGVVFGISYGIVYSELFNSDNPALIQALSDPSTGYKVFADGLVLSLSILNGAYSLITGFLWSLLLKQKSALHIHIPF